MTARAGSAAYAGTTIQRIALIVGIAFLLLGVAGFLPGITSDLGELRFAGPSSQAYLFGVLQVSVLHNAVHLAFGVVGVIVAAHPTASRHFLLWGGVLNAALWTYGLFTGGREGDVLPLNRAAVWVHLGMAVIMVLLALLAGRDPRTKDTGIKQLD